MSRMNGSAERRGRYTSRLGLLVALLSICGGCATYTDHLKEAHALYRQSRHVEAEASVDALLNELREDGADPNGSNIPLLQVEKATLLMARGEYAEACSLWATADSSLEVLDLRNTTGESIARFLFSDTAGPYAMHPYEKGMLNTLNMLCFLAEGNLSSSRVEARRYAIVDTFYELEEEGDTGAGNPLGDWLAGVVFSLSGNSEIAQRYVRQLEQRAPEFADQNWLPRGEKENRIPVVVGLGTAPRKRPVRLPIGMALAIAGHHSPPSKASNALIAQGLVTWVNFTELVEITPETEALTLRTTDGELELFPILDLKQAIYEQFEKDKPLMIGAAISRALTRAALGQGAGKATGRDGWGTLLSLAIQGTMVAMDTPDTRSWTILPREFWVGWVEEGTTTLQVERRLRSGIVTHSERNLQPAQGAFPVLYP